MMLVALELLIVAVIGAAIETITLKKVKSNELIYFIAFITGVVTATVVFYIFKING